jgi:hypothetical protein
MSTWKATVGWMSKWKRPGSKKVLKGERTEWMKSVIQKPSKNATKHGSPPQIRVPPHVLGLMKWWNLFLRKLKVKRMM